MNALFAPFIELLSCGSNEVVQQITANLEKILPPIYGNLANRFERRNSLPGPLKLVAFLTYTQQFTFPIA